MFDLIKRVFNRKERETIDALRKYQIVYNTPEGRWVLNDILNLCGYGGSALGKDTEETYWKIGQQNVGLEIAQRLTANIVKLEEESKALELANEVAE